MARGRQQKWICLDCEAAFAAQGMAPKMCCACDSPKIGRAPSAELAQNFAEKRAELNVACADLNKLTVSTQGLNPSTTRSWTIGSSNGDTDSSAERNTTSLRPCSLSGILKMTRIQEIQ